MNPNPIDLNNGSGTPLSIPLPTNKSRSDSLQNAQRAIMMDEDEDSSPLEAVRNVQKPEYQDEIRQYEEVVIKYPGNLSETQLEYGLFSLIVAGLYSPQIQHRIAASIPSFSTLTGQQSTLGLFATAAAAAAGFITVRAHFQK